ncbi:UDP-4-amino-4,6-dideoxy-N-acetyl-beta-L-altrosamine N-acetyltransferase [Desmospora activa]|uniref:UDP-4-amino-4, 6-dideoxy-N-acetyl-beta-L-altrosamine N-acetyltransferase n=1 Tax=Desmospora activa DSM 45169 TaxID=1121389 RepID=A0A2T4ZAD0_9BACL|nr:UDP-4-amino-4,6-dideoxy-N-acetyl-beta-L-altrosamine N-acetyltransferase [Desmospora activa]PTM58854.1 UDP-4-amino-4,6-dideoxy-N-acetyl-beta-L-altrosamine N-acetyltransferase [Desmospora activa DSM 45169]
MPRYADCRLRPMTEDDLAMVLDWRNSEPIRKLSLSDRAITMEEHRQWFQGVFDTPCHPLLFEYQEEPAGVVTFSRWDPYHHRCFWGCYLGRTDLPKGTGTAMGYLALEYAFDRLGVRKLCGETLACNTRALRFERKLEIIDVEGYLVEHILRDGRYEDLICVRALNRDWQERKTLLKSRLFSD